MAHKQCNSMGILKPGISSKRQIIDNAKRGDFWASKCLKDYGGIHVRLFEIGLGLYDALCRIYEVSIFRMLLIPVFPWYLTTDFFVELIDHYKIKSVSSMCYYCYGVYLTPRILLMRVPENSIRSKES